MFAEFIAYYQNGTCRPLESTGVTAQRIAITASVGINGKNRPDDVQVIQRALNDVPPNQGKPVPPLVVDGISGPKTRKAIQTFQLKHFGWKLADGRVDPDKPTIARLNELAGGASALQP